MAVATMLGMAFVGAVGWRVLRRGRHRDAGHGHLLELEATALGTWADAACPACLALAVLQTKSLATPLNKPKAILTVYVRVRLGGSTLWGHWELAKR